MYAGLRLGGWESEVKSVAESQSQSRRVFDWQSRQFFTPPFWLGHAAFAAGIRLRVRLNFKIFKMRTPFYVCEPGEHRANESVERACVVYTRFVYIVIWWEDEESGAPTYEIHPAT